MASSICCFSDSPRMHVAVSVTLHHPIATSHRFHGATHRCTGLMNSATCIAQAIAKKRSRSPSPQSDNVMVDADAGNCSKRQQRCKTSPSSATSSPAMHSTSLDALATAASIISSDSPCSPIPALASLPPSQPSSNCSSPLPSNSSLSPPLRQRGIVSDRLCACDECFPILSLHPDILIERIIRLVSHVAQTCNSPKSTDAALVFLHSLQFADVHTKAKLPTLMKDFILRFCNIKPNMRCCRRLSPQKEVNEENPRNAAYNPANRTLTRAIAASQSAAAAPYKLQLLASKRNSLSSTRAMSPSEALLKRNTDLSQPNYAIAEVNHATLVA